MANKTPIRAVFNDSNVATGLAEFQSGDTIALTHGGLGAALSIGSAGQVLKVNSGASALEFGFVEAVVNIDNATNLTAATLASSDLFLVSDGGTEGRATLAQIQAAIKDTTATLTNKTISGSANTISNIPTSAITFASSSITGITSLTAGGITITGNTITSADSTVIQMGESLSITGGLTQSSNDIVLGTNTTGNIMVADGSKFSSKAVSALAEITSVATDDVLMAIDTSGGGLKKISRSALVAGLATSSAISNVSEDTTPQLGGDLDINGQNIVTLANGNIDLLPHGSGKIVMDGNGTDGGVLVSDGLIEVKTASGSVAEQRFYCESSNAHYTAVKSAPHASYSGNITLTLPTATGTLAVQSFAIAQAIALG